MEYKTKDNSIEDVCYLITDFLNESKFKLNVVEAKVTRFLNRPDFFTCVVYDNNKPIGLIMAYTYTHPLFDGKASDDFLVYVDKKHRGSSVAVRLIKLYEEWAKQQKVDYILISQATGTGDTERVRMFYEKLGFTTTGYNAMKVS
jgi:GNAT superfamily N-acetyltransferase